MRVEFICNEILLEKERVRKRDRRREKVREEMRWVVRKGEGKEREADGESERKMGDIKEIVIAP